MPDPRGRNTSTAQNPREEIAFTFVAEHQPKLLGLLEYLKKNQPAQYQQALAEIFRSKQRLDNLQRLDPDLYAIELELWRVQSQQRLIAAEISVEQKGDKYDDALKQLKALIETQLVKELERTRLQRARHAKLVEQLDHEIERRASSSADLAAGELKTWRDRIDGLIERKKRTQNRSTDDSK